MTEVLDRFMRYVRVDSASNVDSPSIPSSQGQLRFADLLASELEGMGGAFKVSRLSDGSVLARESASQSSRI
jgi:di/tripeptidase